MRLAPAKAHGQPPTFFVEHSSVRRDEPCLASQCPCGISHQGLSWVESTTPEARYTTESASPGLPA
jgi:hypothetical protein